MGDGLRVSENDTGRQGWEVKDRRRRTEEGMRGKGVTERGNGEFKMTVSELTASSLFLPY